MFGNQLLNVTTVNDDPTMNVEIVERAVHANRLTDGHDVYWTVVYRNTRPDTVITTASVAVTVRDGKGYVLGTESDYLWDVPPNGVQVWKGLTRAENGRPATVELEIREANHSRTGTQPQQYLNFPVGNLRLNAHHDGKWAVSGEITNPYPEQVKNLKVTALARDKDGVLMDSAEGFAGAVGPHRSVPFEVDTWGSRKPVTYNILATPWAQWEKLARLIG